MFEIPDAKKVKRSEVVSSDHNPPSPIASPSQAAVPNYGFEYDFINPAEQLSSKKLDTSLEGQQLQAPNHQPQEESHTFRLFTSTAPTTFTVRPSTPTLEVGLSEGRFTQPSRPDSYYFTSATNPSTLTQQQCQISISAVSSGDILGHSAVPWPGTFLPWRIIHLPPPAKKKALESSTSASNPQSEQLLSAIKRSKPNKKRRITHRKRLDARQSTKQQTVAAEEAERLKRNVRNREKKIKRREKERKKKAEARVQAGVADGDDSPDENEQVVEFKINAVN